MMSLDARMLGLVSLALVLCINLSVGQAPVFTICNSPQEIANAPLGFNGTLVSPGYPGYYPGPKQGVSSSGCSFRIHTCKECKIRIRVDDLVLPPCARDPNLYHGCIPMCDHVYSHEDGFLQATTLTYIMGHNKTVNYDTISKRVSIYLCMSDLNRNSSKKFKISFEVVPKLIHQRGSVTGAPRSGYIRSPNFPFGTPVNDEVYTYVLENLTPGGRVMITFDDWDLFDNSHLLFCHMLPDGNCAHARRENGWMNRPKALTSQTNILHIRFDTSFDLHHRHFIGFKFKYQFVPDQSMDHTITACGSYMKDSAGMAFGFARCESQLPYDCLWVFTSYSHPYNYVSLRHNDKLNWDGSDSIEIRDGVTSDAPLLGEYSGHYFPPEVVSNHGLYIRLRIDCSTNQHKNVNMVATAFGNVTKDGTCPASSSAAPFKCLNKRCIRFSLVCDGINHCGDHSDETLGCTMTTTTMRTTTTGRRVTEPFRCSPHYACDNGYQCYFRWQRCDQRCNCDDCSDETGCPPLTPAPLVNPLHLATGLSVGVAVIIVLAAIIIYCRYKRKQAQIRRRNQLAYYRANRVNLDGDMSRSEMTRLNISLQLQHERHGGRDAPPTYDESNCGGGGGGGMLNMSYVGSDYIGRTESPPPYSVAPQSEQNQRSSDADAVPTDGASSTPRDHSEESREPLIENTSENQPNHVRDPVGETSSQHASRTSLCNETTPKSREIQSTGVGDARARSREELSARRFTSMCELPSGSDGQQGINESQKGALQSWKSLAFIPTHTSHNDHSRASSARNTENVQKVVNPNKKKALNRKFRSMNDINLVVNFSSNSEGNGRQKDNAPLARGSLRNEGANGGKPRSGALLASRSLHDVRLGEGATGEAGNTGVEAPRLSLSARPGGTSDV